MIKTSPDNDRCTLYSPVNVKEHNQEKNTRSQFNMFSIGIYREVIPNTEISYREIEPYSAIKSHIEIKPYRKIYTMQC